MPSGRWLGIDVGSAHKKVCSFCLIESDGTGHPTISFEQGPAGDGYPQTNTKDTLLDPDNPPTYLKEEVEGAVGEVLARAEVVDRWFRSVGDGISAVAVDAPVALAMEGSKRLTEGASSQPFDTPDRASFEAAIRDKGDPYLRVNVFWKCVGLSVYRHLAARLEPRSAVTDQRTIASWTCPGETTEWRVRETFPSDVYKRANGREGTLSPDARDVLRTLVAAPDWRAAGPKGRRPVRQTLDRLTTIRDFLRTDIAATDRLCEMRKRNGTYGDLWDAFTCAFTACCEDHGGATFHGLENGDTEVPAILRSEGAILTVTSQR
jgi:hypothetical protein